MKHQNIKPDPVAVGNFFKKRKRAVFSQRRAVTDAAHALMTNLFAIVGPLEVFPGDCTRLTTFDSRMTLLSLTARMFLRQYR